MVSNLISSAIYASRNCMTAVWSQPFWNKGNSLLNSKGKPNSREPHLALEH